MIIRALLSTLTLWVNLSLAASNEDMVIVAHASVSDQTISRSFARQLFSMKARQWPDGAPTVVYVLPDHSPYHLRFVKAILGTFPYKLRAAWDRQVYSGTGQAPREVADLTQMVRLIASTPGAMGYAPRQSIDGTSMHIVEVR
ncbi:MAG TPA: hypothetical protein VGD04_03625 [Methylophilus sp.]